MPEGYASPEPSKFEEANDWFLRRTVVSDADRKSIPVDKRQRAFWLAGVQSLEMVQAVRDSLDKAIAGDVKFYDWQKEWGPRFAALFGQPKPFWLETVWRNAVQSSFNAGRYAQLTDPLIMKLRPYWRFDAIDDQRTTPICNFLDNSVIAADDPWWDTHFPPLHHRCRSLVVSLRLKEALARGITGPPESDKDEHQVTGGWGNAPKSGHDAWKPTVRKPGEKTGLDADLVKTLEAKKPKVEKALGEPAPLKLLPKPVSIDDVKRRVQELPAIAPIDASSRKPKDYEDEASRVRSAASPEQRAAVREYSGNDFQLIADALILDENAWTVAYGSSHRDPTEEYRRARVKAADIQRLIENEGGSKAVPRKLYRGISLDDPELVHHFLESPTVVTRKPISTSRSAETARSFSADRAVGVIFVIENTTTDLVIPLSSMSTQGDGEQELLIGAGKVYRVVKREWFEEANGTPTLVLHLKETDSGMPPSDAPRMSLR